MSTCKHCEVFDGIYDWSCDGCCARFLAGVPAVEVRRMWLDRWGKQFNPERVEAIKELMKGIWERKKQEALSYAKR